MIAGFATGCAVFKVGHATSHPGHNMVNGQFLAGKCFITVLASVQVT
jgi:hypothetical protein